MRSHRGIGGCVLVALIGCGPGDVVDDAAIREVGALDADVSSDGAVRDATGATTDVRTGEVDAVVDAHLPADAHEQADAYEPPDAHMPADASTCGNGIEEAGERCCTEEDHAALVAALVPEGAATRSYCVPPGRFEDSATGTYCTDTVAACGGPGCVIEAPDDVWTVSLTSPSEAVVRAIVHGDVAVVLRGTAIGGLPYFCDVTVAGTARVTTHYAISDSGTHVEAAPGAFTPDGLFDVDSSWPCASAVSRHGASTIRGHFIEAVFRALHDEHVPVRRACAY